uniref:DDRGK domain-containing protein 1-like n=1 Tax=Styela clava TaxID=7725 RepID=UPI00193ACBC1|nr:DDRGK domain-containing protein 1-like [Styela clava]
MDENSQDNFDESNYGINFGPSKENMFYVMIFYVVFIVTGIFFLMWKLRGYNRPDPTTDFKSFMKQHAVEGDHKSDKRTDESRDANADVVRRRRNIRARIQESTNHQQGDAIEEIENDDEKGPAEKIGAKKLKKIQEKEEKRKLREMVEAERGERKKRQIEEEELRKIKEEKQIEFEKQKEEEERLVKEQKEREDHELYLEMKKSFEIDEEGQCENDDEEQEQSKLQIFIDYIKENKVVLLEDLASHFGMRTQEAIDRVKDLLEDESITGVIDDRGKLIYITMDELQAVASFVKRRGRVAISDIAAESNKLIDLQQSHKNSL